MAFCLPALFSGHDESIPLSAWGIKASHKTLLPQTHWNVWFLALSAYWESSLSPNYSDLGSHPNGYPEFSSVTLSARNNGRQMLETFTLKCWHFTISNGFPVQMGQWQLLKGKQHRQFTSGNNVGQVCRVEVIVESRNVMTKQAARVGLGREKRDWR